MKAEDIFRELNTNIDGLSSEEAKKRIDQYFDAWGVPPLWGHTKFYQLRKTNRFLERKIQGPNPALLLSVDQHRYLIIKKKHNYYSSIYS